MYGYRLGEFVCRRFSGLRVSSFFFFQDQQFAKCENMPELEFNDLLTNYGTTCTTVYE